MEEGEGGREGERHLCEVGDRGLSKVGKEEREEERERERACGQEGARARPRH